MLRSPCDGSTETGTGSSPTRKIGCGSTWTATAGGTRQCRHVATALGDWKTLLEQPADVLPVLLEMRGVQSVQAGRAADAVQAVAKLRELGTATANQLYSAACVYSRCAANISASGRREPAETSEGSRPPLALTAEQSAARQQHIAAALGTLREAIAACYKDFAHMQKDPDLAVLREHPDYKELVEKLKAGQTRSAK